MNLRQRIYLDHNATAPLSRQVKVMLEESGFANPSSVHGSGKRIKRQLNDVRSFLFQTFGLSSKEFNLFFHSGATEGINTIVKGMALKAFEEKKKMSFFSLGSDHSCVANQKCVLELLGHDFIEVPINSRGEVDDDQLISLINESKSDFNLLNWTWVNNETGVVLPLEQISRIKENVMPKLYVHVDAVQSIGKIKQWQKLQSDLDGYTLSGHKFGALKGCGASFLRADFPRMALLNGGGQQLGIRSGTENTYGILSLKVALEDVLENYQFDKQLEAKSWFESQLVEALADKGEIIARDTTRNGNTIYFLFHEIRAQSAAMVFDMASIDLSNGSACSSGAVIPSRPLLAMGYNEEQAKSALRLSFPWDFTMEMAQDYWNAFEGPLKRLLSNN